MTSKEEQIQVLATAGSLQQRLPPELIVLIIQSCNDFPTLAALAATSKAYSTDAQHVLFETVVENETRRYDLAKILHDNPRLAGHVVTLSAVYPGTGTWPQVFDKMVKLKHLILRLDRPNPPRPSMLAAVSINLETLVWGTADDLDPNPGFFSCLESLPNLLRLCIAGTTKDFNDLRFKKSVTQEMCPKLQYISGSRAVIEAFLPGRKIKTVVWVANYWDGPGTLKHLRKELALVKNFSFFARHNIGPLSLSPAFVLQHMRSLEYFEVNIQFNLTLDDVRKLAKIRGIIFRLDSGPADGQLETDILEQLHRKFGNSSSDRISLFQHCSRLEFIDCTTGSLSQKLQRGRPFERWVPNEDMTAELSLGTIFAKDILEHVEGEGTMAGKLYA